MSMFILLCIIIFFTLLPNTKTGECGNTAFDFHVKLWILSPAISILQKATNSNPLQSYLNHTLEAAGWREPEWMDPRFWWRPLYEYAATDKRRYFPLFVATTCSRKQPYRIGGEGGGRKEGEGSAGDTLWWWHCSTLPQPPPNKPVCRHGLSLLVLGLTGPQGLSLAAISATLLPAAKLQPSLSSRIRNSKCHEIWKHPKTRREVSSWRVLEAICVEFIGKTPLWPWLWPVKALCAHFHHLMTAQIMPTTASGVQPRKIMNNKCSSECHQSFPSVFTGLRSPIFQPVEFQMILRESKLQTKTSFPGTLLQPSRFPIKDNNSTGNGEPKVLWLLKQETPEKY